MQPLLKQRFTQGGLILSILGSIGLLWYGIVAPPSFPFARFAAGGSVAVSAPPRIVIAFRNDDITAYSNPAQESAILSVFRNHNVRQTFSVIPDPGALPDADAENSLQMSPIRDSLLAWQAAGNVSFALHGYTHKQHHHSAGEFDGVSLNKQRDRLRRGKAILDHALNTSVTMFAPPWNQADENTLTACNELGLNRFSGYRGAPPMPGMLMLNTNTVLFPDTNYDEAGHELPALRVVLPYAHRTQGTCFLLVFYHSRADFNAPSRFVALDSMLTLLGHDSLVTIVPFDELGRMYGPALATYNIAGLNLLQIDDAKHYAALMSATFSWIGGKLGRTNSMDSLKYRALERYYTGDYTAVNALAGEAVGMYEQQTRVGRGVLAVLLGALVFLIARRNDPRAAGRYGMIIRNVPFALVAVICFTLIVIRLTHSFSPTRTEDLFVLGAMGALALLIGGLARNAREKQT